MSLDHFFPRLTRDATSFSDSRGTLNVLYETEQIVLKRSSSKQGVFRGLHRQASPSLQTKIIRVISGKIIDFVAIPDNPDEVIWYSEISPKDEWIRIDPHLAHGFYALEDVVFEYFCDGRYDESLEECYRIDTIIHNELGILNMNLSKKDQNGKPFGKVMRPHDKEMSTIS